MVHATDARAGSEAVAEASLLQARYDDTAHLVRLILIALLGTAVLPVLVWYAVRVMHLQTAVSDSVKIGVEDGAAAPQARLALEAGAGTTTSPAAVAEPAETGPEGLEPFNQLLASSVGFLTSARESLDLLSAKLPLRQVLARELAAVGRALDRLVSEAAVSGGTDLAVVRRIEPQMQALVGDLRRLAEIAAGAQSSLIETERSEQRTAEPRDKAEAYRLLGANPDVSERIAKKLVEALRQSWHPDFARDDQDRLCREERIKEINVAWDLIRGKRAGA